MHVAKALVIGTCLLALQGCAAAVLSVAGIAGGAGFEHFINGIVSYTFPSPIAGTRLATLKALKRMGMTVEKEGRSEDGWTVVAKATDRKINIEFEELSEKSVQMRVDVHRNKFIFLKDPSTGKQIIEQTKVELSRLSFERSRIATVQMMLSALGYDTKNADGILGPKTERAIRRFQRRNAFRADGKVSSRLVAKLQKKRDARKATKKRLEKKALMDKGWQ